MKKCFGVILSVFIISVLSSCIKEEYDPAKLTTDYSPEVAIPLVHSVLSVNDILDHADDPTDDLTQESNGLLNLIYKTNISTPAANSFISFPGVSILQPFIAANVNTPEVADSIDLNLKLFNKVTDGSFYFEDPRLHIKFENSFGTPLEVNLTRLEAWSSGNGLVPAILTNLSGDTMQQSTIFFSPAYSSIPGQVATTTYSFDKTNSNLEDWVTETAANRFVFYAARGIINNSPSIPANTFITDSSTLNIEVKVELPLYGRGNYVVLGDTVPFNMDINEPSGSPINASEATLVINTYNGFPLEAIIQIAFLDSSNSIIDSLFSGDQKEVIEAPIIGGSPDFKVLAPSHKMTEITVNKDRLDQWAKADRIIITGSLSTSGQSTDLVKIYAGYSLEIKLAARAKLFLE